MNKTLVTIVALSIDTNFAILYKPDGDTITIRQGDPRLPGIVETARDPLSRGEPVEVDITIIYAKQDAYAETEKGTNGLVKFFRVAKKLVQDTINTESPEQVAPDVAHITPLSLGLVPGVEQEPEPVVTVPEVVPPASYKLIVQQYGENFNKVALIKALRTVNNLGLLEAKNLAEMPLPYQVKDGITGEQLAWHVAEMEKATGTSVLFLEEQDDIKLHTQDGQSFNSLLEPEKEAATGSPVVPLVPAAPVVEPTNAEKVAAANAKMDQLISAGAQSTDKEEFHKPLDEKTETIVAVNTQTGAIIPDAQKLVPHMKSAAKLEDYVGFTKFFERLSAIVKDRGHSVEDLMKFMHQGDLPIADDGCIVAYKRLQSRDDHFVDCHTKKVKQKLGSFVFMRHGLVDPNRRQDCSNGLHIAALSYLSGFSGNITVVVKINPEDVFAVPEYSHNKMRVAGYHIVAVLPAKLRELVNSGGAISSTPEGANILNNILRGNHVGITQTVEIGGNHGAKLTIKDVAGSTEDKGQVFKKTEAKNTTVEVGANASGEIDETPKADPVLAADIKPTAEPTEEMSQKDHVRQQFALLGTSDKDAAHKIAVDLMALKTRTGKSWKALGLTDIQASTLRNYVKTAEDTQNPVKAKAPAKAKAAKPAKAKAEKVKAAPKSGSPRATIRDLIGKGIAANLAAILATKKQAKKGWAALGVTEAEQAEIEKASK